MIAARRRAIAARSAAGLSGARLPVASAGGGLALNPGAAAGWAFGAAGSGWALTLIVGPVAGVAAAALCSAFA
jgi:hypothetical protein